MATLNEKLTKTVVEKLMPVGGKDRFVWDSVLTGFGLKITPTGRKVYVVQYRPKGEKQSRRYTIGVHGPARTCEEARTEASKILRDVETGLDPAQAREDAKTAKTVKDLCESYLEAAERGLILGKKNAPKKPSTLATDRGRIDRHILPLLGKRTVKDLRTVDITKFMRDVARGETAAVVKTDKLRGKAIVEGGAGTAARTVGLLGGILSFAVSDGIIDHNPARGVRRPADRKRSVRLTPEQYRSLGLALDAEEAEGGSSVGVAAIWLLALTGCRRGEILGLKWQEVDQAGRSLRLADTKEGASVRPAGSPMFDILSGLDRGEDSDFVLIGKHGGPFGALPDVWAKVAKRAGLGTVTPHGLRHAFASVANDLGYTEATIAAMVGHSAGSTTSRYVHNLDDALVAAADRVAKTIWGYMASGDAD